MIPASATSKAATYYHDGSGSSVFEPSHWECTQRLQQAIDYNVDHWGKVVVSISPCTFRIPGIGSYIEVDVRNSDSPGDSQARAFEILDIHTDLRRAHDMDAFDATLRQLVEGATER